MSEVQVHSPRIKTLGARDSFNLTKQIELETTNPEQAKACKAAAGVGE